MVRRDELTPLPGPFHPKTFHSMNRLINRENLLALLLCLLAIALIIATTDSSPQWIYQGF